MRVDSVPTVHVFVSSNYICMCKCLLRKAAASALEVSIVCFPPVYISCVVRRIVPSRGRFHADVAVILRGKSMYEVVMDFVILFWKRWRLDRGVSVTRGPSHTCGKTGVSFP